jgi:hypothetical protein
MPVLYAISVNLAKKRTPNGILFDVVNVFSTGVHDERHVDPVSFFLLHENL